MNLVRGLKAVASTRRLHILQLLGGANALASVHRGLNGKALCKLMKISQPALSEQMQTLLDSGLVESKKVGRSVFYSRDEERILQLLETIIDELLPAATTK